MNAAPDEGPGAMSNGRSGPDGFPYQTDAPGANVYRLLDAYLSACLEAPPDHPANSSSMRVEHLLELAEQQSGCTARTMLPQVTLAALERLTWGHDRQQAWEGDWWQDIGRPLHNLVWVACAGLAPAAASMAPAALDGILRAVCASRWLSGVCWQDMMQLVEFTVRAHGLTDERRRLVWSLADYVRFSGVNAVMGHEERSLPDRRDALTHRVPTGTICAGEDWADLALTELCALDEKARRSWDAFLRHMLTATSAKPSAVWLRRAGQLRHGSNRADSA